ncbi:DUF934 domain-containing protein [Methylocystis sp.]|uniref:DUF934 domain-containing protein n=1 Tax=Methylocystis sp. TaxID=1911079 RepID=UPI0026007150|nr:DUF934 domain-containing protein [Methylocystis sp.]
MALISDGRFVEDAWRRLADEEALPKAGKVIVSFPRLEHALEVLGPMSSLGVIVPNTTEPSALVEALPRLGLVSISFPGFADGRGFSLARLLRRAGFKGELRASGRLVADQYSHVVGSGFDTIEIPDDLAERQDEEQWRAALNAYSMSYQRGYTGRGSILEARRRAARS